MSITHKGWTFDQDESEDGDGFYTMDDIAVDPDGKQHYLDTSRFNFQMSQERFEWFIDNKLPRRSFFNSIGPITTNEVDNELMKTRTIT